MLKNRKQFVAVVAVSSMFLGLVHTEANAKSSGSSSSGGGGGRPSSGGGGSSGGGRTSSGGGGSTVRPSNGGGGGRTPSGGGGSSSGGGGGRTSSGGGGGSSSGGGRGRTSSGGGGGSSSGGGLALLGSGDSNTGMRQIIANGKQPITANGNKNDPFFKPGEKVYPLAVLTDKNTSKLVIRDANSGQSWQIAVKPQDIDTPKELQAVIAKEIQKIEQKSQGGSYQLNQNSQTGWGVNCSVGTNGSGCGGNLNNQNGNGATQNNNFNARQGDYSIAVVRPGNNVIVQSTPSGMVLESRTGNTQAIAQTLYTNKSKSVESPLVWQPPGSTRVRFIDDTANMNVNGPAFDPKTNTRIYPSPPKPTTPTPPRVCRDYFDVFAQKMKTICGPIPDGAYLR